MSADASTPLQHSHTNADGTTITGSGTAWVFSSWTELVASTASGWVLAGLRIGGSYSNIQAEIDIGRGAAAAELPITRVRIHGPNSGGGGPALVWLPIPQLGILSGDRVSARVRANNGSANLKVSLLYYDDTFDGDSTAAPLTAAPAGAAGVSVTPSSTPWADSAWVELVPSLAEDGALAGLAVARPVGSLDIEWDLGTGGAGAETVITTIRSATWGADLALLSVLHLPSVYPVPAGTRVAVRMRTSGTSTTSHTTALIYYGAFGVPMQQVTQLVALVGYDDRAVPPPVLGPCVGGGTVATGTNPAAGTSLATASSVLIWFETTINGITYEWAKTAINATTRKAPRVLSFGSLVRALTGSRHGFETPSLTLRLSDYDRVLRGLHGSGLLPRQIGHVYMADEATVRAGGTPWRVFTGVIREFKAESELTYTLVLEDKLTMASSVFAQERKVPSVVVDAVISDANPLEKVRGIPVPLIYGNLSDEDADEPDGVIPCPMISAVTLDGHEDLGNLYRFMIGKGVTGDVHNVFGADALSADPPVDRAPLVEDDFGVSVWAPHRDGWMYGAGQPYDLINASRFSFLYLDQTHPAAELGRSGRIPITVNVCGYDDVGDGSGNTIESLPRQFLHFLNNFVAQQATGNWLSMATLSGSTTLFNTQSFEAVRTASIARIGGVGYIGAFLLGHSRKQITLREAIRQFCLCGDFDLGVNRFGQLMLTMLDRTATASTAPLLTDVDDILAGSFSVDSGLDEIENRIRYKYKRRYVPALQAVNPEEGSRGLREPFDGEWESGELQLDDEDAQADLGEVRESDVLEFEMIRDAATATDVAEQRLARRARPRPVATFAVTVRRGMDLELGDLIRVTHAQGLSAAGWTARRMQVRRLVVDLDRLLVTITALDVDDLLA